jgi:hypothetical protein
VRAQTHNLLNCLLSPLCKEDIHFGIFQYFLSWVRQQIVFAFYFMELDCINRCELFWLYRKIRCAAFVHLIFGFKVRGVRKSREIPTPFRPPGVKFLVDILVYNSDLLFSTPYSCNCGSSILLQPPFRKNTCREI